MLLSRYKKTQRMKFEVNEFWADSTIIEAGDFVFIAYYIQGIGTFSSSIKKFILSNKKPSIHLVEWTTFIIYINL